MANKPEKVFRLGFVSGSVFGNALETEGGPRTLRSVTIPRRYLDGDQPRYTSSFGLAEIPQAMRVLELAQRYIESKEAEVALD